MLVGKNIFITKSYIKNVETFDHLEGTAIFLTILSLSRPGLDEAQNTKYLSFLFSLSPGIYQTRPLHMVKHLTIMLVQYIQTKKQFVLNTNVDHLRIALPR